MKKEEYFSDDCIVENSLFKSLKELLICPLCKNIFKEPLMCSECQGVFCEKCLDNYLSGKVCPNKCHNNKFSKSISKNELLSKIKYKCKNCKKEVMQSDINSHLESNCQPKTQIERKKTLAKLSKDEMREIEKEKINHFTSKSN